MENGVVNLINHLPRERFRHAVVCIEDYSDFRQRIENPDVKVYALHRSKIGVWRLRWLLFSLLRRLNPDIVHSRNLSGLDALLPARLAGIKTLHSEHGFDVDNLHGQASRPGLLRRLHVPLVLRYVTVSRDLRRLMSERWGVPSGRVTQIYNGVDTEHFCQSLSRRQDLLPNDWRLDGLFVIGTIGRARPIKDQATLLRAFAAVLRRRPEWRVRLRLVLIGDGPLLDSLKQLAVELDIDDQIWFAGERHDVADLLQALDLFVLPSLNEGISNTLLEAMATGIPVLATAVGGNMEVLDEGIHGASFVPGDHGRLAALIEQYSDSVELCIRHGTASRERAVQCFSLNAMLVKYHDVYEAL